MPEDELSSNFIDFVLVEPEQLYHWIDDEDPKGQIEDGLCAFLFLKDVLIDRVPNVFYAENIDQLVLVAHARGTAVYDIAEICGGEARPTKLAVK